MDKIIEELSKLSPFTTWFEKLGFNKEVSASFSVVLFLILAYFIVYLSKKIYKKYNKRKEAIRNIKPQFDYLSIKKARKYYIPTQYQNASPTRQEEPGFTHKYIARNKLIPFFTEKVFAEKAEADRFYLILADSGMGKTTFMINLYLSFYNFFSRQKDYRMKLFRFSNTDTINHIKSYSVDKAKRTILLLDALDEDLGVVSRSADISDADAFRTRIDELIELTRNFRVVIMTCRTQYFPGQEDDPYELKIKRPDEKGYYILNKIYISPFNEKEVKVYLNKKFGFLPFVYRKKKQKAKHIVTQSINLLMRPMLLSYIDYLLEDDRIFKTTYQLYKTLVKKWLEREADKRKSINDRQIFITNLNDLSRHTAICIYLNWKKDGRMFISREEAILIADQFKIELRSEEITGQSLLTYDGYGNWKFAHKSILEFFLAEEAILHPRFLRELNFKGMDMAKKFYEEIEQKLVHVQISNFALEEFKNFDQLQELPLGLQDFYIHDMPVTIEEFEMLAGNVGTRFDSVFQQSTLPEAMSYCNALNNKNGYPDVYDKNYNFLNENGEIVNDISLVHGFRLPTEMEWELAFFRSKSLHFKGSKNISFEYNHPEWCFDLAGYCMKVATKINDIGATNYNYSFRNHEGGERNPTLETQLINILHEKLFKEIAWKFKIETNKNITGYETKQFLVTFRTVFVP